MYRSPGAVLALLLASSLPALAAARPPSGYTVSRTSDGVRLTLHFGRRPYPAHALVAVTAILRNLSHRNLAVQGTGRTFGPCSGPAVSMVSVNAQGKDVEPIPPIPVPIPDCPFIPPNDLPIGHSAVEHQLIVLWSSRLHVTAQLFNHRHNSDQGFSFQGPAVRFRLHRSPAPTISVRNTRGLSIAVISPPPGARGPLYYRSWGACSFAFYWTPLRTPVVSSGCFQPKQWHLDVAWLNSPVTTLNLGVRRIRHER